MSLFTVPGWDYPPEIKALSGQALVDACVAFEDKADAPVEVSLPFEAASSLLDALGAKLGGREPKVGLEVKCEPKKFRAAMEKLRREDRLCELTRKKQIVLSWSGVGLEEEDSEYTTEEWMVFLLLLDLMCIKAQEINSYVLCTL